MLSLELLCNCIKSRCTALRYSIRGLLSASGGLQTDLKSIQKLHRVKRFLAIELPLFSQIMQTRYHLKERKERNKERIFVPRIHKGALSAFRGIHHSKAQVFVDSTMKLDFAQIDSFYCRLS